jgi:hypothetical protein
MNIRTLFVGVAIISASPVAVAADDDDVLPRSVEQARAFAINVLDNLPPAAYGRHRIRATYVNDVGDPLDESDRLYFDAHYDVILDFAGLLIDEETRSYERFLGDQPTSYRSVSYWTGKHWHQFRPDDKIIAIMPLRSRSFVETALGLMLGMDGPLLVFRGTIRHVIENAPLRSWHIEDERSEFLYRFGTNATMRIQFVHDPSPAIALIEFRFPQQGEGDVDDGAYRWLRYRVESWMSVNGRKLPRIAFREEGASGLPEESIRGEVRFRRCRLERVAYAEFDEVGAAQTRFEAVSDVRDGVWVIDDRGDLRFRVGSDRIEVDGHTFSTAAHHAPYERILYQLPEVLRDAQMLEHGDANGDRDDQRQSLNEAKEMDRVDPNGALIGVKFIDFGDYWAPSLEHRLDHVFELTNQLDEAIAIEGVRSSCGCLVASLSTHHLEPGETVKIAIELSLDRPGPRRERVTLMLGEHGMETLEAVAFVRRADSWRASHELVQLKQGESAKVLLILLTHSDLAPLEVDIACPHGFDCAIDEWVLVFSHNEDAGRPARWHAVLHVRRESGDTLPADARIEALLPQHRTLVIRLAGYPWR